MSDSRALIIPEQLRSALTLERHVNFDLMLTDDPTAPTILTNVDTKTEGGETMVFNAVAPPTFAIDTMIGQTFLLNSFYSHRIEIASREGGEIVNAIRTVLFNPAGETVAVVSRGITDSLGVLMGLRGYGPWVPAIPILFRETRTNNKRRVYSFVIAPKPPAEGKTRK
jgi:hypothetical protein